MSRRLHAVLFSFVLASLTCAPFALADDAGFTPLYGQLQWRLVGPFRGGWSTMAEGVPSQPNVFYFGGADGGMWKTVDAGLTWKPLFQDAPSISIGALAIASSNPDILYIGTGQPETRYDIVDGAGVYRSDDGGQSWKSMGLTDTRHIGRIWVDPRDPNLVIVAALGHIFGPNEERGVFRSEDGGQHWSKVLYVDADTGAVDLAVDPTKPEVMYATTWQARNHAWLSYFMPDQGPGSGIWKSLDAGKTWARLSGNGLPDGDLGRIGIAVAPNSSAARVYALVESADDAKTALYRSDDGGGHWASEGSSDLVSSYFDRLTVDPTDKDTLYVMNRSVAKSTDGGKSFTWFKGAPGGDDYHFLWINPLDTHHMVLASDQGTTVTVDGGKTWSPWYNQPTGQFYHVTTDNRFPYHIYSGQQDSGTIETESSSDYGEITFRDWNPVGGDERSYVVPDAADPNIVYVGGLGGHISRYDKRTGQVQNITATPLAGYARRPTTVKYRYTWFYPLVSDPHKGHTLYVASQYLFKTTDGGMHWKQLSGDLTGPDPKHATGCDGSSFTLQQARDCGFGAIFSIAPSPVKESVLWVGTDDGLVQLSRDGGKHWQDVTPSQMPFYGRVNQVEASPLDPATAYVAVDTHRQDTFKPYIFKTHDYGKTWQSIVGGIPPEQFVYVVRQDLKDPALLYAGTNAGVFVSFDDGGRWQPLQANLPTARVRDLTLHGDDLIAATHGRAIWVLDDVSPLRHLSAKLQGEAAHLFTPATAIRVRRNNNKDTPLPPEIPAGVNPPEGAILDYWLGQNAGPVTLEIDDAQGRLVRRFASDAPPAPLETDRYFTEAWLSAPEKLESTPGAHRFIWDLRYPRPPSLSYDYSIAAVFEKGGAILPQGPLVLPGHYSVKLTVGGTSLSAPLTVALDPRVPAKAAKLALPQQLTLERQMDDALAESFGAHAALTALRTDIAVAKKGLAVGDTALQASLTDLDGKAEQLADKAPQHKNFAAINSALTSLVNEVDDGDHAPAAQYHQSYAEYRAALDAALTQWQTLREHDLVQVNAALKAGGHSELKTEAP